MALRVRYTSSLALCLGWLVACQQDPAPRTEVMVVVDSDLTVPDELDNLSIQIAGPADSSVGATAQLGPGEPPLPRSLGLVHEAGPLGPLEVHVEGRLGDTLVLARRAQLSFVAGRTLVLPIHLVRSCLGATCSGEQTCTEQGCASPVVAVDELSEWTGEKPELDAGEPVLDAGAQDASDEDAQPAEDAASTQDSSQTDSAASDASSDDAAAMCTPAPEQCNRLDDDCDGRIDDGFNLLTNSNHCGACNNRCQSRDTCCRGTCQRSCQ